MSIHIQRTVLPSSVRAGVRSRSSAVPRCRRRRSPRRPGRWPTAAIRAAGFRYVLNYSSWYGSPAAVLRYAEAEAARVRELSETVRALAPEKPQLYIARPGMARLRPFAPLADVAGADSYPIGSGDPSVRQATQSAQVVTAAAGVRTAMVLQAFSWSQYRPSPGSRGFPGQRKLTAMRNAAIRHADPTMILWYSYQDILRSKDPRKRWRELTSAAFTPTH